MTRCMIPLEDDVSHLAKALLAVPAILNASFILTKEVEIREQQSRTAVDLLDHTLHLIREMDRLGHSPLSRGLESGVSTLEAFLEKIESKAEKTSLERSEAPMICRLNTESGADVTCVPLSEDTHGKHADQECGTHTLRLQASGVELASSSHPNQSKECKTTCL